MWSRRGTGYSATSPANTFTVLRPNRFRADGTKPGVLLLHGTGANDASNFLTRPSNLAGLARVITQAGYPCVAPFVGDTFGNDAALGLVTEASAQLTAIGAKPGPRVLLGGSMGSAAAMVWARANPLSVSCIVGLLPLADLTDVHGNDRGGNQSRIDTAYGSRVDAGCGTVAGSPVVTDSAILAGDAGRPVKGAGIPANATVSSVVAGTSFQLRVGGVAANATATATVPLTIGGYTQPVYGAAKNPATFGAQLAGLPVQLWAAQSDTTVLPATVDALGALIGVSAEVRPIAGGHTDAALANVDVAAVLAFLAAHA